jgi:hypothetical protein
MEFLTFLVNNFDYKHETWLLHRDIERKLKDEEERQAFVVANGNMEVYQNFVSHRMLFGSKEN